MNKKAYQEYESIRSLIEQADYKSALSLMGQSKHLRGTLAFDIFYIWIGTQTNDESLIKRGVNAATKKVNKAQADPDELAQAHYNIGNGYLVMLEICLNEGKSLYDEDIQKIIKKCRSHYEKVPPTHGFTELAKTNLANLLDTIGRPVESIGKYEEALRINPEHAMATANMAMAIAAMAPVSSYEGAYYIYAYQLYRKALQNPKSIISVGGASALEKFQLQSETIYKMFDAKNNSHLLDNDLRHPHRSQVDAGDWLRRYTDFCIDKDLYLNLHIHDKNSDASVGDPLIVNPVTPVGDNQTAQDIFFRLNEIKESFMTARYIFAQSQLTNDQVSEVSNQAVLINVGYSTSNLYVGMLKNAYKETVGVLDKIAILINHYLKMGNNENDPRLDYRKVWYKNLNKKEGLAEAIVGAKLPHYLYGVFSIFQEIESLDHGLRNTLTHRYAKVYVMMLEDSTNSYLFHDLVERTTKLQYLTKCAIISMIMFINSMEKSKRASSQRHGKIVPSMPLWSDQMLDAWPSYKS